MLVALRDLGQHRRIVAEGGFHIPAGNIAADAGPAAVVPRGVDQQQNTNGRPLMVEHVAKARETLGHLAPFHPVVARSDLKAARQEIGDGGKIGASYLAASDHGPNSVIRSDPASSSAGRRARARRADRGRRPARESPDRAAPSLRLWRRAGIPVTERAPSCASYRYPWCPNARYPPRSEIGLVRLLPVRASGLERVARCDAMYSSQLR